MVEREVKWMVRGGGVMMVVGVLEREGGREGRRMRIRRMMGGVEEVGVGVGGEGEGRKGIEGE